jgi:transcriptional regulator with XRE-family HTH domain
MESHSFYYHLTKLKHQNESDCAFAKRCGVSKQVMWRWKNGAYPGWEMINLVARTLKVHPQIILNGKEDRIGRKD